MVNHHHVSATMLGEFFLTLKSKVGLLNLGAGFSMMFYVDSEN